MTPMLPLPLVDGALFISGTFIDQCMTCAQAAAYYKLNQRVSATPASALTFGGHLHTALEFRLRQQEFGLSEEAITALVHPLLEKEFSLAPVEEGDFRGLNWALKLYEEHCKRFPVDPATLLKYAEPVTCPQCKGAQTSPACLWCQGSGKQSLMVEVPFIFKLCDLPNLSLSSALPIYYHGFIDLPIQVGTQLWVNDWKTSSRMDESFWVDKRASSAQKGYCYGLQTLLGRKVQGYSVRALRTKQPPQYVIDGLANRKGETKRLTDWFDESFREERFHLADGELEEWRTNTIDIVEEWLWHYWAGRFPKRTTSCAGKYGKCPYFEACWTFPPSERELIINSGMFKEKSTNQHLMLPA